MTRYTVKTDSIPPKFAALGFAAWICDAEHPDGESASCSWHQDEADAWRVCRALNAEPKLYRALQDFVDRWYRFPKKPTGKELDVYIDNSRAALEWARLPKGMIAPPDHLEAECHGYDLDGNPVGAQYDYEGEAVDIAVFIRDNEIVHPDDLADIRNLKAGELLRYGGGAAPITVLRRVR